MLSNYEFYSRQSSLPADPFIRISIPGNSGLLGDRNKWGRSRSMPPRILQVKGRKSIHPSYTGMRTIPNCYPAGIGVGVSVSVGTPGPDKGVGVESQVGSGLGLSIGLPATTMEKRDVSNENTSFHGSKVGSGVTNIESSNSTCIENVNLAKRRLSIALTASVNVPLHDTNTRKTNRSPKISAHSEINSERTSNFVKFKSVKEIIRKNSWTEIDPAIAETGPSGTNFKQKVVEIRPNTKTNSNQKKKPTSEVNTYTKYHQSAELSTPVCETYENPTINQLAPKECLHGTSISFESHANYRSQKEGQKNKFISKRLKLRCKSSIVTADDIDMHLKCRSNNNTVIQNLPQTTAAGLKPPRGNSNTKRPASASDVLHKRSVNGSDKDHQFQKNKNAPNLHSILYVNQSPVLSTLRSSNRKMSVQQQNGLCRENLDENKVFKEDNEKDILDTIAMALQGHSQTLNSVSSNRIDKADSLKQQARMKYSVRLLTRETRKLLQSKPQLQPTIKTLSTQKSDNHTCKYGGIFKVNQVSCSSFDKTSERKKKVSLKQVLTIPRPKVFVDDQSSISL